MIKNVLLILQNEDLLVSWLFIINIAKTLCLTESTRFFSSIDPDFKIDYC